MYGTFYDQLKKYHPEIRKACESALNEFRAKKRLSKDEILFKETTLKKDLLKNEGPNYKDPGIVGAYLKKYHSSHFTMTFQLFATILKSIPKQNIYVCDIGAGTAAGLAGILVALDCQTKLDVNLYFDMVESSDEMTEAAKLFLNRLNISSKNSLVEMRWFSSVDSSFVPPTLPNGTTKIVAAFHLSLPYELYLLQTHLGDPSRTLKQALKKINPPHGLFTTNEYKMDTLHNTVRQHFDSFPDSIREQGSIPSRGTFYTPTRANYLYYDLVNYCPLIYSKL